MDALVTVCKQLLGCCGRFVRQAKRRNPCTIVVQKWLAKRCFVLDMVKEGRTCCRLNCLSGRRKGLMILLCPNQRICALLSFDQHVRLLLSAEKIHPKCVGRVQRVEMCGQWFVSWSNKARG